MKTAATQMALNACASNESARVESQRKALYNRVLARARGPQAISKIKNAEEDWVEYRRAYIDAMYPLANKQRNYGTIYPTEVNVLFADLTRAHIKDLKRLLAGPAGMICGARC